MIKQLKKLIYPLILTYKYVVGKAKAYRSGQEKSKFGILLDLISWQIREFDFNYYYNAYGLNLEGSRQKEYISRKEFLKLKNRVEHKLKTQAGCQGYNYDIVTKDKFISNTFLSANNIPCFENIALYCKSRIIFRDGAQTDIFGFKKLGGAFFVKNVVLEAGDGVLLCNVVNDRIEVNGTLNTFESFAGILGKQVWVVQQQYKSSKGIRKINSTALNTTRIVTILNNNYPEYLCGFQAFATGGATNDSWSKGSVYVGIDIKRQCLKAEGFCSLENKEQSILYHHPDSGIEFNEYPVPYLQEAVELCIKAHKLLYFSFIIGWDVAITDNGPMIVEANEKPGMNVAQCVDGGLKDRIFDCSGTI